VIVPRGLADMHAVLVTARGIAAVSAGRHEDAFAILGRLFDPADPAHHYREQYGGLHYYARAAAACGRADQARVVIARLGAETASLSLQRAVGAARDVLVTRAA
jgi:hypothetical protein